MSAAEAKGLRLSEKAEILYYTFPNILKTSVDLSQNGQLWLDILKREGILRLAPEDLAKVAQHVDETYFSKLSPGKKTELTGEELGNPELFAKTTNHEKFEEYGTKLLCEISFKDEGLHPLIFNPDLTGLCYNYYHRQPFYRNQPVIQLLEFGDENKSAEGGAFHVDRMHQISFMLLLSDVSEKDTHMEYVLGSHRRSLWKTGIMLSKRDADQMAKSGPVMKCIGEKGTLYVFDASGVHRRSLKAGTSRKILHLNITTGHHLRPFTDRRGNWGRLASVPSYIRNMFDKLPE